MSRHVPNGSAGLMDYESGGADAALVTTGDFSVGMWLRFTANSDLTDGILLQRGFFTGGAGEAGNINFYFYLTGAANSFDIGYLHQFGAGSTIEGPNVFTTDFPNDTWCYFGASRNVTAKTVIVYKLVSHVFSTVSTYTYSNNPTGGNDAGCRMTHFGRYNPSFPNVAQQGDDVYLAHVSFYHSVLSADQHYANALGRPVYGMSPLIWCPMWGAADPEPDWSGNGNNGDVTVGTVNGSLLHPPVPPPFNGSLEIAASSTGVQGIGPLVLGRSGAIVGRSSRVIGV